MANMTCKDREQLRRWLASKATLGEVEDASRYGLVGNERFTKAARRAYILIWIWSAFRFSDMYLAATKQTRHRDRCGKKLFYRRIARCKAIADRLAKGE